MKKFSKLFVLTAMLLLCAATLTFNASAFVFPGLSGFPSTVSEGSVWLIAGIAVIVIAVAAILFVKKVKSSKKNKKTNKE